MEEQGSLRVFAFLSTDFGNAKLENNCFGNHLDRFCCMCCWPGPLTIQNKRDACTYSQPCSETRPQEKGWEQGRWGKTTQ